MGLFSAGNKSSSSYDNRAGASEDGQLAQGNAVASKDDAVSLGGQSNNNNLGGEIRAGGNVTLTDGGAFALARDFVGSYNKTLADLTTSQQSSTASTIDNLLTKFGTLVESRNTDGQSNNNKTVLYIAIAIAAVFGIFFWRRSR